MLNFLNKERKNFQPCLAFLKMKKINKIFVSDNLKKDYAIKYLVKVIKGELVSLH
jgi:hypothetical protein